MIRALFLVMALLAPGLAYAGNPSATFSDQVVPATSPGGVVCDIGPNAPSVPVAAQKAGFTHCNMNADWTSTSTDRNGWNFSNPNTYVSECGASPASINNSIWHVGFIHQSATQGTNIVWTAAPCSRVVITTDPTYGNQALYLEFFPSDYTDSGSTHLDNLWFAWPAGENNQGPCGPSGYPYCGGGPNGAGMAEQIYVETVFRVTPTSLQTAPGTQTLATDWWQSEAQGGGYPAAPEIDFYELQTSYCSGTSCDVGGGMYGLNEPNVAAYQHLGYLITNNGTGTGSACVYVGDTAISNGVASQCKTFSTSTGSDYFQKLIDYWVGGDDCYGDPGCMINPAELYVQYIRVWTCSAQWWENQCYGTLITSQKEVPWYKKLAQRIGSFFLATAKADVFDPPYQGFWRCSDGRYKMHDDCMPQEFKGVEWWKSCVAGRSDCITSDTAAIGFDKNRRVIRGRGNCYTEQPYTCWFNGKGPR